MGIEAYLRWENQTGDGGEDCHLQEAYHGGPYVIEVLFPEALASAPDAGQEYPVRILRKRLKKAIAAAIRRDKAVYGHEECSKSCPKVQAFVRFVEIAGAKEKETGKPCYVYVQY